MVEMSGTKSMLHLFHTFDGINGIDVVYYSCPFSPPSFCMDVGSTETRVVMATALFCP